MSADASSDNPRRPPGGAADATLSQDALKRFTLDGFLASSAKLWRDRLAMRDARAGGGPAFTCAGLDAEVGRMAAVLAHLGLAAGERVVICGGADPSAVVMLLASLRAGLDAALALPTLTPAQVAGVARDIRAAAILGETEVPGIGSADMMLSAAAQAPCVRLLCTAGGAVDGAAPLDAAAWTHEDIRAVAAVAATGAIITLGLDADGVRPVFHRQATFVAAALDFVRRTRIGANTPILSTIAPVTFAGLVAGPVGALLSGAPLHLHTPFAAAAFLDALDACAPAHLIVPARIGADVVRAGLLAPSTLASLILLARRQVECTPLPDEGPVGAVPVFDLRAFGERAAIAEVRPPSAALAPPGREPHVVSVDATKILAFEAREASGRLEIRGAGVTGGEEWSVP